MQLIPTTHRVLLAIYLAAAALVFLYVGFPSEALRTHVAYRMSASLPGLTLAVAEVRPSLVPVGITLRDVRISHADRPLAVIDRLRLQPDLTSLLRSKTSYGFEGAIGSGDITGRAEVDSTGPQPKVSLNARFGGILLQQLPGLRGLYGSRLAGRLDGTIAVNEAGALTGKLTVTDGQVELAAPVLDQQNFTFRTIEADITLQNRSLLLRNGRLRGNELDAEISGTVALDQPQGAGALNLSGRVTPHPAFMARAEGSLPANLLRRRAAFPFRVSGPLDSPGFSLN
ncbi:MAG: type II secretion system protein GspN [Hyphomicrobiales bacterium]